MGHLKATYSMSLHIEEAERQSLHEIETKVKMIKSVSDSLYEADDLVEEISAKNKEYIMLSDQLKKENKTLKEQNEKYQILVQDLKNYQQKQEIAAEKKLKSLEEKLVILTNEKTDVLKQNEELQVEYDTLKTQTDEQMQETMDLTSPMIQSKMMNEMQQSIHIQFAKTNTVNYNQGPSTVNLLVKWKKTRIHRLFRHQGMS